MQAKVEPRFVVTHRNQAKSFWQPTPANGYSTVMLSAEQTASGKVSMGTQTIAAGCHVREHLHGDREEIIFVLEGHGTATVEGIEHPMTPGAFFYLGPNTRHTFENPGPEPLTVSWTMVPAGLENFFEAIGRPRKAGETAPVPFERPDDANPGVTSFVQPITSAERAQNAQNAQKK